MRKFGWQIGQEITLKGTVFPVDLTFKLLGEITTETGNAMIFWFDRRYLEEAMERFGGMRAVGMIWLRAERPEMVDGIMRGVTDLFRNSEAEVSAETEKSFYAGFGFLVVGAVVVIAANTSAMGVRERVPEIAVLKSLGFRRRPILIALLAESTAVAFVGGLLGAGSAYVIFKALAAAGKTGNAMPFLGPLATFQVSPAVAAQGLAIALAVGLVAGLIPAWNGARLNVAEALRRLF
jgi:putative ABC transport system permease protein